MYPLNINYVHAVSDPENFINLKPIQTVRDGNDIKSATGGFAIVFKMYKPDEKRHYAVKCFTRHVANRMERLDAHTPLPRRPTRAVF